MTISSFYSFATIETMGDRKPLPMDHTRALTSGKIRSHARLVKKNTLQSINVAPFLLNIDINQLLTDCTCTLQIKARNV